MNSRNAEQDELKTFQLMNEIESGESVSQRELAGRLGVAVGLVNSYLKNFVAKGYVRVKNYPRNRYAYLLTPKGFAEKSRLAYQHLEYFNSLYKTAREDYASLFAELASASHNKVAFYGIGEVAEIAYLSMQETNMEMAAIFSEDKIGELFFGHRIRSLAELRDWRGAPIVVAVSKNREKILEDLHALSLYEPIFCPGLTGNNR